jgi:hypothetical protein
MLNDIQKAFIKKHNQKSYAQKDLMVECAGDFGRLIASGEKDGLSTLVAFECAKNHFRIYGQAMVDFSNLVTIEMCPPSKQTHHVGDKNE